MATPFKIPEGFVTRKYLLEMVLTDLVSKNLAHSLIDRLAKSNSEEVVFLRNSGGGSVYAYSPKFVEIWKNHLKNMEDDAKKENKWWSIYKTSQCLSMGMVRLYRIISKERKLHPEFFRTKDCSLYNVINGQPFTFEINAIHEDWIVSIREKIDQEKKDRQKYSKIFELVQTRRSHAGRKPGLDYYDERSRK
jgi:hypothetical protein